MTVCGAFVAGLFLGGTVGVVLMGLLVAASRGNDAPRCDECPVRPVENLLKTP